MSNRRLLMVVPVLFFICLIGVIQATADDVEKININTAAEEELVQLNGVGYEYAARIIEYRETWGPFKTPEDLMQVKGIGQKTFEKNMEIIIVEDPPDNLAAEDPPDNQQEDHDTHHRFNEN
jgi:competence protein ComEA